MRLSTRTRKDSLLCCTHKASRGQKSAAHTAFQIFCWRYGISRSTAYKLAKEGRLRFVKIGGRSLILHEDAEALVRQGA
jgi:excisionase family DNA binding protein